LPTAGLVINTPRRPARQWGIWPRSRPIGARSGQNLGRPRLSRELHELIATMASEKPLWALSASATSSSSSGSGSALARSGASAGTSDHADPARPGAPSSPTMLQAVWAADILRVQTLQFQTLSQTTIFHENPTSSRHLARGDRARPGQGFAASTRAGRSAISRCSAHFHNRHSPNTLSEYRSPARPQS
jgi:hypothetical protein